MARINPKGERRGPARSFLGALDTYIKPERDVSGAQALQAGLGQLGNAMGNASARLKKEQDARNYELGKADYLRTAVGKEPVGIKEGTLFRSQSRFYQMGLAEAQGEAKAIEWANGLQTAYKEWDGRGSSDPNAFRSWMNEQSATFLDSLGEEAHALGAAMPYINRANQNMANHHVTYRDQQLKVARFNAFDTKIGDTLDQFELNGISAEDMAGVFENQIKLMVGSGENGSEVVNKIIQQATHHANAYDNPEILRAIAKLHDDGIFKLSKANQATLADANDKVENDLLRRNRIDSAKATELSDAAELKLMGDWASALTEDPYATLPDANTVSADQYKKMALLQDAVIKGKTRISSEQEATNAIAMDDILNDPTLSANEKVNAIVKYASENPVEDISEFIKEAHSESHPDAIQSSKTYKESKKAFLTSINSALDFKIMGQDAKLTSAVRVHYDNYVRRFGGAVDKNDADSLFEFTAKAEEYALKQVYKVDPTVFEGITDKNIRNVLGLDAIKAEANAEKAEKIRIKKEKDAAEFKALLDSDTATVINAENEAELAKAKAEAEKAEADRKKAEADLLAIKEAELKKAEAEKKAKAELAAKVEETIAKVETTVDTSFDVSGEITDIFMAMPNDVTDPSAWILDELNKKYEGADIGLPEKDIKFLIDSIVGSGDSGASKVDSVISKAEAILSDSKETSAKAEAVLSESEVNSVISKAESVLTDSKETSAKAEAVLSEEVDSDFSAKIEKASGAIFDLYMEMPTSVTDKEAWITEAFKKKYKDNSLGLPEKDIKYLIKQLTK